MKITNIDQARVKRAGTDQAFHLAKVNAIKVAMREGRFQVDAGVVADRLIESARGLRLARVRG